MTGNDFDKLLSAPLAPVEDSGFSVRIARQVLAARERRETIEWLGLLVAACIFLAVVPLTGLMRVIVYIGISIGNSFPLAMAVMAIVLTLTYARLVADRSN